jgi:hypothetical protein
MRVTGGEAGIRTLGRVLKPYNGLANRRFRPLSHLTARGAHYSRTRTCRFQTFNLNHLIGRMSAEIGPGTRSIALARALQRFETL